MTDSPELVRRYKQLEQSLEPQKQRSVARGPIGLIAVLVLLVLAVGTVVAVDLNRLRTPRGTALAWTGATVFGDCRAYERLSVPGPGVEEELSDERCERLQEQTAPAREESGRYSIEVVAVEQDGDEATVRIELGRREDARVVTRTVDLPLRRGGDAWVVVRTAEVCRVLDCP